MASKDFSAIEQISLHLKQLFQGNAKATLLYAYNGTGKTRLARTFLGETESDRIESIVYSAFFEDIFTWDNEAHTLHFTVESSWILRTIRDQGLDSRIVANFERHTYSKVEPVIDFADESISFRVATGDDQSTEGIKISRGEESLLVWSIFYTIIDYVIEVLDEDESLRETNAYNDLKYIVIDDPVSSMDDTRIVGIAIDVAAMTKRLAEKGIKVLITTHHALFHNVIANSKVSGCKQFSLSKTNEGWQLKGQDDAPFGYHLHTRRLIQESIENDSIERYHFNLFRALLEKAANFLGYGQFEDCLRETNKEKFKRSLHLNSHGKLSEMESRELSVDDKELFIDTFNQFTEDYRWSKN